jgi:peroxiredoxin
VNPPPSQPAKEVALPPIALQALDGKPTQLAAALDGHPALVSLWATWCEACGEEFSALTRLDERARAHGAKVIAVAVGEPRATVAEFVARHHLPYAQLVDEEFHFSDALGQKRVPATLVIDARGKVVFVGGALDSAALAALRSTLGEENPL